SARRPCLRRRANRWSDPSCLVPARNKFAPMRLRALFYVFAQERALAAILLERPHAAQELEAQEKQVGVRAICFAIIPDALHVAGPVLLPNSRTVSADL